jgi:hypothetical protein
MVVAYVLRKFGALMVTDIPIQDDDGPRDRNSGCSGRNRGIFYACAVAAREDAIAASRA